MRIAEGVYAPLADGVKIGNDIAALIRWSEDAWAKCGPTEDATQPATAGTED